MDEEVLILGCIFLMSWSCLCPAWHLGHILAHLSWFYTVYVFLFFISAKRKAIRFSTHEPQHAIIVVLTKITTVNKTLSKKKWRPTANLPLWRGGRIATWTVKILPFLPYAAARAAPDRMCTTQRKIVLSDFTVADAAAIAAAASTWCERTFFARLQRWFRRVSDYVWTNAWSHAWLTAVWCRRIITMDNG